MKKLFIVSIITLYLTSCHKHNDKQNTDKDIIFYEFPAPVIKFIEDSILSKRKIDHIYLPYNLEKEDEFVITLTYWTKNQRTIALRNTSNRKAILKGDTLSIIFGSDTYFAKIKEDSMHYIEDFNAAIIKFNIDGEIKESIIFQKE